MIILGALFWTTTGSTVPPPTVNWQAGGAGHPVRRPRKTAKHLFDAIERTLRDTLNPPPVQFEVTTKRAALDLDAALAELTTVSQGYADLSAEVARIRTEVATYQKRKQAQDDDDDAILLSLL